MTVCLYILRDEIIRSQICPHLFETALAETCRHQIVDTWILVEVQVTDKVDNHANVLKDLPAFRPEMKRVPALYVSKAGCNALQRIATLNDSR